MFTLESNIPVPPFQPRGRRLLYPFKSMQVGQSFLIPTTEETLKVVRAKLTSSVSA